MRPGTVLLAALLATSAAPAAIAATEGTVVLHPDRPGPVISRDIFGQFAEMLGEGIYGGVYVGPDSPIPNVRGMRSDVVQALKALKVPNVRWPGGCYGDVYHWRDGIGRNRRARVNVNWGGVVEPNTFGTHEFMDFVEQIGSEAYISVNLGSGTVQEAADWLEYMTAGQPTALARERAANGREQPWKIKYLGLGNEPWGCGGGFTPESYVERMKPFALHAQNLNPAQRATTPFSTHPDAMRRVAAGEGLGKPAYTEAIMKAWQQRALFSWNVEYLSLHLYIAPGATPLIDSSTDFGEKEYAALMAKAYTMDRMIAEHATIMDSHDPAKKVKIAVDEWGAWLRPLPDRPLMFLRQQNSLRDALAGAVQLNIFARHADRVGMANIAQMVNVIQAMILTDGDKMLLTPTYHVFRMYVPFQDATLVPIDVDAGQYRMGSTAVPRVDAVAARGEDGKLWLSLVNLDPGEPASIVLRGSGARIASGEMMTAGAVNAVNTFARPETVSPQPFVARGAKGVLTLSLAPRSLTVVELR